ncbi:MAG: ATP-binding protein [Gemmatimonadales bacterium]
MSIVFVGGTHGSGKSTLCARLSSSLGVRHITASALISFLPDSTDPTQKAVADIDANQDRIIRALDKLRQTSNTLIILDGHFCLLSTDGRIVPVAVATFARVDPIALILVEAEAHLVSRRLKQRTKQPLDVSVIERLGAAERAQAETVSSALGKPLLLWNARMRLDRAKKFIFAHSVPE